MTVAGSHRCSGQTLTPTAHSDSICSDDWTSTAAPRGWPPRQADKRMAAREFAAALADRDDDLHQVSPVRLDSGPQLIWLWPGAPKSESMWDLDAVGAHAERHHSAALQIDAGHLDPASTGKRLPRKRTCSPPADGSAG